MASPENRTSLRSRLRAAMKASVPLGIFSLLGYFIYNSYGASIESPGCQLRLNSDLPKEREPVMFIKATSNGSLTFAMPDNAPFSFSDIIFLQKDQELIVACPGTENFVVVSHSEASGALCVNSTIFSVSNKDYKSEQLECNHRATATLVITKDSCAYGNGTMIELGFDVGGWHRLVRVCHNIKECSTYYSQHKLHGASLEGRVHDPFRPSFRRGSDQLYQGMSPSDAYNMSNQIEVLEEIVGKKNLEKYFVPEKNLFLARGHLAPNGDFLFSSWQHLTFFYVNVAPQWQSINAGYWVTVEDAVRTLAIKLSVDLNVATGTHGVLSLPDIKGAPKEMYLSSGRLPVPEVYWKILHNPQDDSCIALVSTNNPFLESPPKLLCSDVCSQYHWPELKSDFSKGYVYCCRFEDLKKAVVNVPDFLCESVLPFA